MNNATALRSVKHDTIARLGQLCILLGVLNIAIPCSISAEAINQSTYSQDELSQYLSLELPALVGSRAKVNLTHREMSLVSPQDETVELGKDIWTSAPGADIQPPASAKAGQLFFAARYLARVLIQENHKNQALSGRFTARERALITECEATVAASYIATKSVLDRRASALPSDWEEPVRKLNISLAIALNSESPKTSKELGGPAPQVLEAILGVTAASPDENLFLPIVPWFDRDITFLAVSAGSGGALTRVGNSIPISQRNRVAPSGLTDMRDVSESFDGWSERICSRFVFTKTSLVDYIELAQVKVTEHDGPTEITGNAVVQLKNVGARRLKGTTLLVVLGDDENSVGFNPSVQSVDILDFDLPPLKQKTVTIPLAIRKELGRGIRVLMGPDSSPTAVQATGEPVYIGTCAERIAASRTKEPIAFALVEYAKDAGNSFKNSSAKKLSTQAEILPRAGAYAVPGAIKVEIDRLPERVRVTYYQGSSASKARAIFSDVTASISGICGKAVGKLDTEPNGFGQLSAYSIKMFSPDSSLEVSVGKESGDAKSNLNDEQYSVTLDISKHWRLFP